MWYQVIKWISNDTDPQVPDWTSREALEELVGKKVGLRSGWEKEATFLLLNYKPETDYGHTIRTYMKNTISVEAEKAHHGHADENAISTLTHGGALLLHDGGYHEKLPNGRYRSDYYHNRVVVQRSLMREGESAHGFLKTTDGHYHPTEIQRIDFRTFREVEFSRTRVIDRSARWRHAPYRRVPQVHPLFRGHRRRDVSEGGALHPVVALLCA